MEIAQKSTEIAELSAAEKSSVLRQMERLLASSHFKNSRRYTDLLRFVVERTLEGHAETLKERTLGIEIFGRDPGFDTSGDSIVRVAAAEVRKRIAQYYQEESHQHELRIDLPSGSYVPRFRRVPEAIATIAPEPAIAPSSDEAAKAAIVTKHATSSFRLRLSVTVTAVLLVAMAVLAGAIYIVWPHEKKDLLSPIWKSPNDAIFSIGAPRLVQTQPGADAQTNASLGEPTANNTLVPFADALAFARLQTLLANHGKRSRAQLAGSTSFGDLRSGPAILIGAFDNPWTLRLTSKMRFRFVGTDQLEGQITDSKAKTDNRWVVDFHVPYSDRTQDFGIVAITHDDTLDQPLLIAAGIGPNGTMAASEFLMNHADLEAVTRMAPASWKGNNVEILLATQVIQGNSGPPRILAAEFW